MNGNTKLAAPAAPWSGMKDIIQGQLLSFVVDFIIPLLSLALFAYAIYQIVQIFVDKGNGAIRDFPARIGWIAGCIVVGIGLTSIWVLFASYL